MADRNKVLEMIAKMSRLTEDAGAFKGEASAAAAKIQELMEKYAISQMDIQGYLADQQDKEFKEEFKTAASEKTFKSVKEWEWHLARIISKITMTRHYASGIGANRYGGTTRMIFFGMETNAKAAAEMYALWHENIYKMAKRAQTLNVQRILREYKGIKDPLKHYATDHPEDDPRYYRATWIKACLIAIETNIYEEQKAREKVDSVQGEPGKGTNGANTSALVLYRAEVDKAYNAMSQHFRAVKTGGSRGWSSSGNRDGKATGSQIRIGSKQLD